MKILPFVKFTSLENLYVYGSPFYIRHITPSVLLYDIVKVFNDTWHTYVAILWQFLHVTQKNLSLHPYCKASPCTQGFKGPLIGSGMFVFPPVGILWTLLFLLLLLLLCTCVDFVGLTFCTLCRPLVINGYALQINWFLINAYYVMWWSGIVYIIKNYMIVNFWS